MKQHFKIFLQIFLWRKAIQKLAYAQTLCTNLKCTSSVACLARIIYGIVYISSVTFCHNLSIYIAKQKSDLSFIVKQYANLKRRYTSFGANITTFKSVHFNYQLNKNKMLGKI